MPEPIQSPPQNSPSLERIIGIMRQIANPHIEESRFDSIRNFIETTINGDTVKAGLTIPANLDKDKKGILVYLLTDLRLIKIDIDEKETASTSVFLKAVTGIERKLADGKAAVQFFFTSGSFGLSYAANNQEIVNFFQTVDQARAVANA